MKHLLNIIFFSANSVQILLLKSYGFINNTVNDIICFWHSLLFFCVFLWCFWQANIIYFLFFIESLLFHWLSAHLLESPFLLNLKYFLILFYFTYRCHYYYTCLHFKPVNRTPKIVLVELTHLRSSFKKILLKKLLLKNILLKKNQLKKLLMKHFHVKIFFLDSTNESFVKY